MPKKKQAKKVTKRTPRQPTTKAEAPKRQPVRQPVHETSGTPPLPGQQTLPGMPGLPAFGYANPQPAVLSTPPQAPSSEVPVAAQTSVASQPVTEPAVDGSTKKKRSPRKKAGEQPDPSNGNGNGHAEVTRESYTVELRGTTAALVAVEAKARGLTMEQCIALLVEGALSIPKEKAPLTTEGSGRPPLFTEEELMTSTMQWLREQQEQQASP